jgi:hypothetical protein
MWFIPPPGGGGHFFFSSGTVYIWDSRACPRLCYKLENSVQLPRYWQFRRQLTASGPFFIQSWQKSVCSRSLIADGQTCKRQLWYRKRQIYCEMREVEKMVRKIRLEVVESVSMWHSDSQTNSGKAYERNLATIVRYHQLATIVRYRQAGQLLCQGSWIESGGHLGHLVFGTATVGITVGAARHATLQQN